MALNNPYAQIKKRPQPPPQQQQPLSQDFGTNLDGGRSSSNNNNNNSKFTQNPYSARNASTSNIAPCSSSASTTNATRTSKLGTINGSNNNTNKNKTTTAPVHNPYLKYKKSSSSLTTSSSTSTSSSMPSPINPYLKERTVATMNQSPSSNGNNDSRRRAADYDKNNSSCSSQPSQFHATVATTNTTTTTNQSNSNQASSASTTFIHRPTQNATSSTTSTSTSTSSSGSNSNKPPVFQHTHQKSQKQVPPVAPKPTTTVSAASTAAASMASLRPSSWSSSSNQINTSTSKNYQTSNNGSMNTSSGDKMIGSSHLSSMTKTAAAAKAAAPVPHLDDENPLPRELWYDPTKLKPVQDQHKLKLIQNAQLSSPLQNGWTLFPHQKKAVIRALQMRRMVLALDMGLGKTLIGCVWAKAFEGTYNNNNDEGHGGDTNIKANCDGSDSDDDSYDSDVQIVSSSSKRDRDREQAQLQNSSSFKIIVVCPVTLTVEWKRTAKDRVGLKIEGDDDGDDSDGDKTKRGKKKRKTKEKGSSVSASSNKKSGSIRIYSWAKVPNMVERSVHNYVVVCDEAHSMQSMTSARTRDILALVGDKRCAGVLLLTGTPMKNGKPLNLFPLLRAVRHPLGKHQRAYEQHFCQGRLKQFARGPTWDASGTSNLEQLRRLVRPNLLHMTKEDCLKDLPPMNNVFHDVPVSRSSHLEYRQSISILAKTHANATSGVQNGVSDEAVLGAMQSLRLVCARSKIDAVVGLARSILDEQPAVVIFTSFARVAKEVHQKLSASGWPTELLTGETPQKKRQELVDKFQEGLSSVFVCTFGAGGVGVTLTAASTIILLDRPWTPGETRQAEDRIRRIGQTKVCKSYWLRSFDLDRQIDEMLASKTKTTDTVLNRVSGGHNQASQSSSGSALSAPAAKISIKKLVENFVLSEASKTGAATSSS